MIIILEVKIGNIPFICIVFFNQSNNYMCQYGFESSTTYESQ